MSTRNHTLSQHFLRSPRLAHVLIGHSNLKRRDLVLDIGAGSGVITLALAKRCREVWAIEPDLIAVSKLQANLKKYQITNVRVFQQDFLNLKLPEEPYKIFANPPFGLSSAIFNKLLDAPLPPEAIYLILQKQLALKLINTDRHYTSQLGLRINQSYQTKIRLPLRPSDFTPPPAVPTVLYQAKQIKFPILNN
ncbi:MAG: rRNA adenine N-6-methyltransferase family protein [Candidatus Saccharibacteria bacterium]|nr:rRNA adenine N-6-methyltransferase family protein [Candidatus Saccharibacteria bacterium]